MAHATWQCDRAQRSEDKRGETRREETMREEKRRGETRRDEKDRDEERRPDKPRATNGGPGQHRPGQTHYKETTFFVQVGGNQKHALEQGKCTIPKKQGHGVVCWGGCHQHQNHYSMMGSGCHGLVYRLRMPCRDAIIIRPPKKLPP